MATLHDVLDYNLISWSIILFMILILSMILVLLNTLMPRVQHELDIAISQALQGRIVGKTVVIV